MAAEARVTLSSVMAERRGASMADEADEDDTYVCCDCVGDRHLKEEIRSEGQERGVRFWR